jgi:hypothetical protein
MSKCTHDKIIVIVNTAQTFNVNPDSVYNFDSDVTLGYTIICKFCNYNRTFSDVEKFPRWLFNRWDKISSMMENCK